MPVGNIIHTNSPVIADFRERLTNELKSPKGQYDASADDPILIEDGQPIRFGLSRQPLHLYVIWNVWQELDELERSEIIMEAYRATHEDADAMRVTLAMGLTAGEAKKMGLQYEVKD